MTPVPLPQPILTPQWMDKIQTSTDLGVAIEINFIRPFTPAWKPGMPGSVLRGLMTEAARRLSNNPAPSLWSGLTNSDVSMLIREIAEWYSIDVTRTGTHSWYVLALGALAEESFLRLAKT